MAGKKRIVVEVPADIHRQAKVVAAQTGRNVSDIIRALLDEHLRKNPPRETERGKT
jgi:hypothetical protein